MSFKLFHPRSNPILRISIVIVAAYVFLDFSQFVLNIPEETPWTIYLLWVSLPILILILRYSVEKGRVGFRKYEYISESIFYSALFFSTMIFLRFASYDSVSWYTSWIVFILSFAIPIACHRIWHGISAPARDSEYYRDDENRIILDECSSPDGGFIIGAYVYDLGWDIKSNYCVSMTKTGDNYPTKGNLLETEYPIHCVDWDDATNAVVYIDFDSESDIIPWTYLPPVKFMGNRIHFKKWQRGTSFFPYVRD